MSMQDGPGATLPDPSLAASLAAAATGVPPVAVRRFGTGSMHYVFEVTFAHRPPVVARITTAANRSVMEGAMQLSRLLRPRGVPLPEILAADLAGPFPVLLLERLAGSDFGAVASGLSALSLDRIACRVAHAQAITSALPSAGRYGYATSPEAAPHARWSDVLEAGLARSRSRILRAGLFPVEAVDRVAALVAKCRAALDAVAATPFLHDTTTKNVIVTPKGAFSGIVDVDDLCFGDPRYAPALTLASLKLSGGPIGYVDAWLRHAGLARDRLFEIYVALFLVDFMAEHGQAFNGNETPSRPAARARLLELAAQSSG